MRITQQKYEQLTGKQAKPGRRTLKQIVADNATVKFSVFVPGKPETQGGTVPFRRKDGKTVQVTKGSKGLPAWRKAMTDAFAGAAKQQGIREPLGGALAFSAVFIMPRHSDRTMKGRYYGETEGDMDKQIRAVWDSLKKGRVIVDDSRFCVIRECVKRYAGVEEQPGVIVHVWTLEAAHERID
jgi:Holliday junction resolvase RusA-like endonuclease